MVQDVCESGAEGDLEAEKDDLEFDMSNKVLGGPGTSGALGTTSALASNGGIGTVSKATIAVSDVDGRAFDILLR